MEHYCPPAPLARALGGADRSDMRARLVRISELIESVGLRNVKEPHVRHIRGQLWEIRLKGKAGIARALYVTAKGQRVATVRAFIKKTEKTPTGEIERAPQRAKELNRGRRFAIFIAAGTKARSTRMRTTPSVKSSTSRGR